ncbi:MAG TPA: DGQHR domain-containing protein DpdB [Gemmatimonadaceae bacterium]|nr:DGQHR domain-containing protein DpdB [Gemmatimonadaceae bacterium]
MRTPGGASELRFSALEVRQGRRRVLYSFAVDGKVLPQFATVSRLHRDIDNHIGGYQRPEVLSHIAEIRDYLESRDPMIPNAIVIAFDRRVHFEPSSVQPIEGGYSRLGTLVIPVASDGAAEDRPGWIVDGQQRAAAIREAMISKFPVCVTAFITRSAKEQREQFILVNSTKPLPKGLIYELLPSTEARLPSGLEKRRYPAYLLNRLNHDRDSPLRGLIQTPTTPAGTIKDNSVLKMLDYSLNDGVLYVIRSGNRNSEAGESMLGVLKAFWAAVAEVFPDAWGLPPRRSRLMHGAGIVSMGFLMDAIADRYRQNGLPTRVQFASNLEPLRPVCRWTTGDWQFGKRLRRRWNDIQNTPKDIELLVDHMLNEYRKRVWSRSSQLSRAANQ